MAREAQDDGSVVLQDGRCTFLFTRLRPGVLLVTIRGYDSGALGTAPLDEMSKEVARYQPIQLFVDAREAVGASTSVSDAWTQWFHSNRNGVMRIGVLVRSELMRLTVEVAKLFSRTGDLIQVFTAPEGFEGMVRREVPGFALAQVAARKGINGDGDGAV